MQGWVKKKRRAGEGGESASIVHGERLFKEYSSKNDSSSLLFLVLPCCSVTKLVTCDEYSVFVSTGADKTALIWDMNKFNLMWVLAPHESAVTNAAISGTTGDIVTLCRGASRAVPHSVLRLWTINGDLVGRVETESVVNCVAMSAVPMGVFDNVLVAGCENVGKTPDGLITPKGFGGRE